MLGNRFPPGSERGQLLLPAAAAGPQPVLPVLNDTRIFFYFLVLKERQEVARPTACRQMSDEAFVFTTFSGNTA
ncbi:hypothetical protein EYF80_038043 [Liparis tanakae]|uniref:Uncharacterized protein n=1 Tax=Liparis tanakae TaxID=230148 RepID=A0A4Z2GGF9_9TELE|nr:hypothetical protein EYF80_038043 [Liparis tanakae]